MPGKSLPEQQQVVLSAQEWEEVVSCASALHASIRCYREHGDEAWEAIVASNQRFQRALMPVNERLSDELHGD